MAVAGLCRVDILRGMKFFRVCESVSELCQQCNDKLEEDWSRLSGLPVERKPRKSGRYRFGK
jgi:hypothetical protein